MRGQKSEVSGEHCGEGQQRSLTRVDRAGGHAKELTSEKRLISVKNA